MEIRNIRTFIKAAEQGNFSRAAEDLGYTQSAVSMQIRQLENELGVPLFERNGKLITLSEPGRIFLSHAYRMIKCEEDALSCFRDTDDPEGPLRIGVMESICASPYTDLFYSFMEKYPKVSLNLQVSTTYEALDLLDRGQLDLIFLLDHPSTGKDRHTAFSIPEQILFFCAASHPFALCPALSLSDLLGERFLMVEKGCNYRYAFEQHLILQNLEFPDLLEIGHTRFIIDGVIRKLGISLLPSCTLQEDLKKGTIRLLRLKDYDLTMYVQVIYNKNRWMSPALRCFLDETGKWLNFKSPSR